MPNVEKATVEQVVDAVIDKRSDTNKNKEDGIFGEIFGKFKMTNDEAKNFLLPEENKGDNVFQKLEELKNFSFESLLKPFFNKDLSELKEYLKNNKNNTFVLWKLKYQIEHQQKLNIELAIQQATSTSVESLKSKPVLSQETYPQFSWLYNFWGQKVAIQSYPFQKSSTGTTLCAKTARLNGKYFNLELPSGDAYDAWKILPTTTNYLLTLPERKKTLRPSSSRPTLTKYDFSNTGANFADIYPSSGSPHWHRAVAFRDNITGEWFTLDPYTKVDWVADPTPKPLEEYLEEKKIVKAHFYNSPWYENNSQVA